MRNQLAALKGKTKVMEAYVRLTDQNGTTRQFDRDPLGRPTQDRVSTLGAGVDGSVRRIERGYDVRSNVARITSLDNAAVLSTK